MNKYRLVQKTNNAFIKPYVTYEIEKLRKFLFWKWWSNNYLHDVEGSYTFHKIDEAKNFLSILNKEKQWVDKKIITYESDN